MPAWWCKDLEFPAQKQLRFLKKLLPLQVFFDTSYCNQASQRGSNKRCERRRLGACSFQDASFVKYLMSRFPL